MINGHGHLSLLSTCWSQTLMIRHGEEISSRFMPSQKEKG
tara:strand:+ start:1196 stop:1315 length:120 start_codon:yes stop_codon:yes gene_type:complete